MGENNGRPTDVATACAACGRPLIPLSYGTPAVDAAPNRANLKCTGCGKRYRWIEDEGWIAVD